MLGEDWHISGLGFGAAPPRRLNPRLCRINSVKLRRCRDCGRTNRQLKTDCRVCGGYMRVLRHKVKEKEQNNDE